MDLKRYNWIGRDPARGALAAAMLVACTSTDSVRLQATGYRAQAGATLATSVPSAAAEPVARSLKPVASSCAPLVVELPEISNAPEDPPVPPIVAPERLAGFFERAAAVVRGVSDRHVRIAVYGDSNHTMDFISGRMRRVLQEKYGDAGHGYVAVGRPWSHYRHNDVMHGLQEDRWESYTITTHPILDARYGLAGICAQSVQKGARAWVGTAKDGPIGTSASHFELYYLEQPRAGRVQLVVDGEKREPFSAAGANELGHVVFDLPEGAHRIEMVALDERSVRLLGTILERRGPASFVVDSFGVGSLNSRAHAHEDETINRTMLVERGYDLIVFATGANDVSTLNEAPRHLAKLIALQRSALPDAPILIVTPPDRGRVTQKATREVVEQRIAAAEEHGTALWNMFAAMGGPNAMRGLRNRKLVLPDLTHFNREGGAWIGERLTLALWRAFADYLAAHPQAGCAPASHAAPAVAAQE